MYTKINNLKKEDDFTTIKIRHIIEALNLEEKYLNSEMTMAYNILKHLIFTSTNINLISPEMKEKCLIIAIRRDVFYDMYSTSKIFESE